MAKNKNLSKAILFFAYLVFSTALHAQTVISKSTIANGGAAIQGGSVQLSSTIGQVLIGTASDSKTVQKAGFWYQAGGIITSVNPISDVSPVEFRLYQNHPNPFNPETEIRFQLPKASHVTLKIYNILGQETAVLADAVYPAGLYRVIWDSKNRNGLAVPGGIYFYRLEAQADNGEKYVATKKMTLLR